MIKLISSNAPRQLIQKPVKFIILDEEWNADPFDFILAAPLQLEPHFPAYFDPQTDHVAIDFETYYDAHVSLKEMSTYEYLHRPECDIYLVAIYAGPGDPRNYVGDPYEYDWGSIAGLDWVSHNAAFDSQVYLRLGESAQDEVPLPRAWHCTSNLGCYLRTGRSLKALTETLYPGTRVDKGPRDEMKAKRWETVRDTDLGRRFTRYGGADSFYCWWAWADFGHYLPELERDLSAFTIRQSTRGFPCDLAYVEAAVGTLQVTKDLAKANIPWASPDTDTGILSTPKLSQAVRDLGVTPPRSFAEDNEAFKDWAAAHPDITIVEEVRTFRKANLLQGKLQKMLDRATPEGWVPYGQKYFGGHLGRWSGDEGLNPHNFNKESVAGIDQRRCIHAPPGYKIGVCDLAAIEPRVQLWTIATLPERPWMAAVEYLPSGAYQRTLQAQYAEWAWEQLAKIEAGMSIYEVHARGTMGWTGGNIKKEDPAKQFLAKQRVLAMGYGCGGEKYRTRCKELGVVIPEEQAKRDVAEYRRTTPAIPMMWSVLDTLMADHAYSECPKPGHLDRLPAQARAMPEEVRVAAYRPKVVPLVVELPSGRCLTYFDVHVRPSEKRESRKYGCPQDELWARTERGGRFDMYYGGKLFENWVQAVSRDVFVEATLRVEEVAPVVLGVHDEDVSVVPADFDCELIRELMEVRPAWAQDLPVGAEVASQEPYYKK